MYYERSIAPVIQKINETFPVLIVTGPQQVGKTTLLTHLAGRERKIVSLDNPTIRAFAKSDPELFLQRYAPPVLIDEVQYAPELFDYIKVYVDREKQCGDFWLTGSQTFRMMKRVTESLAGRAGIVRMEGLSNSEINGNHFPAFTVDIPALMDRMTAAPQMSISEIFTRIYKGSMPRLYENEQVDRAQYYESYLETYISRDIKDLSQVGDETTFLNFMAVVAARTATNVNYVRGRRICANRKAVAFDFGILGYRGIDPALFQQCLEAGDQGPENVFSGHGTLRTPHQMDQRGDIGAGCHGRRVL